METGKSANVLATTQNWNTKQPRMSCEQQATSLGWAGQAPYNMNARMQGVPVTFKVPVTVPGCAASLLLSDLFSIVFLCNNSIPEYHQALWMTKPPSVAPMDTKKM